MITSGANQPLPSAGALVERDGMLRALEAQLEAVARGSGRTVLVAGEAGIGKTSVLRSLAATRGDARLWWGACDALQTPHPLAPLHDIARTSEVRFQALLTGDGNRAVLFESVVAELGQSRRPTVLVIEDAHWADEATLDLLKFLGRRIEGLSALLAISYRDDEMTATHPLRRVIGELPLASVTRIEIPPLSAEAVEELARRALQSPAGIYEATRGNPFFVTELLRSGGTGMPRSIRDLVLARFARLSPEAQAIVSLTSIVPREIERGLVDRLLPALPRALEECLNCGLLISARSTLSFRHELARLVIETSLSEPASRALHLRVLNALVDDEGSGASAARLASAATLIAVGGERVERVVAQVAVEQHHG